MKKMFVYILILVIVSAVSYQIGWWRSIGSSAVPEAIARGEIDLGTAWALRRGNVQDALKVLESDLQAATVTLGAFQSQMPKQFLVAFQKFSANVDKYQRQFPESKKLPQ